MASILVVIGYAQFPIKYAPAKSSGIGQEWLNNFLKKNNDKIGVMHDVNSSEGNFMVLTKDGVNDYDDKTCIFIFNRGDSSYMVVMKMKLSMNEYAFAKALCQGNYNGAEVIALNHKTLSSVLPMKKNNL